MKASGNNPLQSRMTCLIADRKHVPVITILQRMDGRKGAGVVGDTGARESLTHRSDISGRLRAPPTCTHSLHCEYTPFRTLLTPPVQPHSSPFHKHAPRPSSASRRRAHSPVSHHQCQNLPTPHANEPQAIIIWYYLYLQPTRRKHPARASITKPHAKWLCLISWRTRTNGLQNKNRLV
ncbi:hypothetical protein BV22DRAFT_776059 [Leucogyrophana mollusca]|uniref:Uncharacterized protein n=1 Tax=Leucogyrophana mollusca TaxID=85980 RepID=A0ACB8B7H2_9AGAM|nr:hypothetical protein BV22DRAFT_776059 [Leucogyrophana mollusca]